MGNNPRTIRILLVDDHEVVRRGLTVFLRAFDDFQLIGEATEGAQALAMCESLQPDVILMDVMMPGMNGPNATRAIRQQYPNIQILALSTFKEEELVREMLMAGAVGYLLKNSSADELANAIRAAVTGKITLSSEAAAALLQPTSHHAPPDYALTQRELEVLTLMVKGLNNVEISERLVVARSTVKFHVSSILAKMNVGSRVEAVSLALQTGLVK
jgi:NarL family two-component system response regulator LiaR